jgi:hypothetical protein
MPGAPAAATDRPSAPAAAPMAAAGTDLQLSRLATRGAAKSRTATDAQAEAERRARREARREARVRDHEEMLSSLWAMQWRHVQLSRLPGDTVVAGQSLLQREPGLVTELATLLRASFQELLDHYLFYAKVARL